jgi:glucosylceramidase
MNTDTHDKAGLEAEVWLTTAGAEARFRRDVGLSPPLPGVDAIAIDPAQAFQAMEGFGFALTGGSAQWIARLPAPARRALLLELFSPEAGIGVSCLRLTLGASDLSAFSFSYDETPPGEEDWALARFDLRAGDAEVVPLLQEILAVNPAIRLLASPWSAPRWMKTNGAWVGGKLRPECYPVYARYLVRYLQAMREQGVAIHALTVQNEPLNIINEPSMAMEPGEQAEFVGAHLGPALREAGLGGVELFCWDHNCDRPDYPLAVLADARANPFLAGVAWHLYAGDIAVLSEVQRAHPGKKMYFTEQWVGNDGQFAGDLAWHVKNVLIGACRHGSRLVLEWNLAADPNCDPHTPGGAPDCKAALTLGEGVERNVAYYVVAHAAKCVRPGSARIFSSLPDGLPNVAFRTPDDAIVLIVLNDGPAWREFNIEYAGRSGSAGLAPGAVATYRWRAG